MFRDRQAFYTAVHFRTESGLNDQNNQQFCFLKSCTAVIVNRVFICFVTTFLVLDHFMP